MFEEVLEYKGNGCGLENRDYGRWGPVTLTTQPSSSHKICHQLFPGSVQSLKRHTTEEVVRTWKKAALPITSVNKKKGTNKVKTRNFFAPYRRRPQWHRLPSLRVRSSKWSSSRKHKKFHPVAERDKRRGQPGLRVP
jgi:hypothetical protein